MTLLCSSRRLRQGKHLTTLKITLADSFRNYLEAKPKEYDL
jgi:hypothetical protein